MTNVRPSRYECPVCFKPIPPDKRGNLMPHKAKGPGAGRYCRGGSAQVGGLREFKLPPEWESLSAMVILIDLTMDADFADPEHGAVLSAAQIWGQLLVMNPEERNRLLTDASDMISDFFWEDSE